MGALNIVKKGVTAGWNVAAWVGVKNIKNNTVLIKDLSKSAFATNKPKDGAPTKETFAQAMRRLNMTEETLQKRIKSSSQIILFCGILTVPMLIYTIYIFMSGFYLSSFVCLMLTCVAAAYCLREHFNRFQMRQRRLGCTFVQWAADSLRLSSSRKK